MAVAFRVCSEPLSHKEVMVLLEDPPESGICNLPSIKPKGGEIFLFKPVEDSQKGGNYIRLASNVNFVLNVKPEGSAKFINP